MLEHLVRVELRWWRVSDRAFRCLVAAKRSPTRIVESSDDRPELAVTGDALNGGRRLVAFWADAASHVTVVGLRHAVLTCAWITFAITVAAGSSIDAGFGRQTPVASERQALDIPSSLDGSAQRSYLVVPPEARNSPRPLLVTLHAWGSDNEGRSPTIEAEAATRGWFVLAPNFRGPSDHPEGCGSRFAQQDILDAVAFVRSRYSVDQARIYLMGYSGGGYMTLLMASRHPETWAAASAWAAIADLAAWYEETSEDRIRSQLRACFGGAPRDDDLIAHYRERSPITYLRPALRVPIEIAHGDHDPQVAVGHALRAFDLLAPGTVPVIERDQIIGAKRAPSGEADPMVKGNILLRRMAGLFRLTIYDGGHDYYPRAGMAWLSEHRKP